jgi:lipid II:glycine glycyltransferase (peptidoglycan interpeptide bridge formation enzyme)
MYAETALRDGFAIRTASYYHALWGAFLGDRLPPGSDFTDPAVPVIEPLVAEVDGEPVAAVMVIRFARRGWYFNGMSLQAHREKMPNYLLQWEAFQRLKAAGCLSYDLWGAPEDFQPGDPLWNVYRFKEGLGGSVVRTLGAWDFPTRPRFYDLYHHVLPRLLSVLRRRGETRIRQAYG